MEDFSRKIDLKYFRACCKVSAANTKGKGRLTFLIQLSAWVHDHAGKGSFRPYAHGAELERQYIEEIVKVVEGAKFGDFDPRAELMECLNNLNA